MKLRGITATLAVSAALTGAATASAGAAPLALEPAQPVTGTAPIGEEYTSTGSSTISASVNAKVICTVQNLITRAGLNC